MIRQRVVLRTRAWSVLVRLLTILFAVAFAYAGVLVVLLAVKVSPHTVDRISGYQTIYGDAVGLRRGDFTTAVSLIAGFGGLLVFLGFAFLALKALPRPYLARTAVDLEPSERGSTTVRPRAVERAAEYAAQDHPNVAAASGRLGDAELNIDVAVRRADDAAETLAEVRRRVGEQLTHHDLPPMPVHVTLTGYERPTRRDLP